MDHAAEYEKALQRARKAFYDDLRRKQLAAFCDEYVAMIAGLVRDVDRGRLSGERAATLARHFRARLERFGDALNRQLDDGTRRAIEQITDAHADAVASAYAVEGKGARVGLAAAAALREVPDRAVEGLMLRRGLGLSTNFSTLVRRRIMDAAPEVDRLLTYAVASGQHGESAALDLATLLAREDPFLRAAIDRTVSQEGRLLRRALNRNVRELGGTERELRALRSLLYDARRIAVTEYNTAHFEGDRAASEVSPVVDLLRWRYSTRHLSLSSSPDVCTYFALADLHGYGAGLFHPASCPSLPHPHCACRTEKVLRPAADWDKPKRDLPTVPYKQDEDTVRDVMQRAQAKHRGKPRAVTPRFVDREAKLAGHKLERAHSYAVGRRRSLKDRFASRGLDGVAPPPAPAVLDRFPVSPEDGRGSDGLELVKTLGGSTGAELVRRRGDGKLFVRKRGAGADHLREEILADLLYNTAGETAGPDGEIPFRNVRAPALRAYETPSGPVKLAEFVEGRVLSEIADPVEVAAAEAQLREGFVLDALLGNWDVVGLSRDNALVDASGRVWRIDNGGSLRFRAQGARKDARFLTAEVQEIDSLRDPAVNAQTARVFGSLTDAELVEQAKAVVDRETDLVVTLATNGAPREVIDLVARRIAWLRDDFIPSRTPRDVGGIPTAAAVREARANGVAVMTDGADIEDLQVLLWEETGADGKPVLRAWLKLRGEGDAKIAAGALSRLAGRPALVPTSRTDPAVYEGYWNDIFAYAKSYNYHHAAGSTPNPVKKAAFEKAYNEVGEDFARQTIPDELFYEFEKAYLDVTNAESHGVAAPFVTKPDLSRLPAAKPPAAGAIVDPVAAVRDPWIFYRADLSRGYVTRTATPNGDVFSGGQPKTDAYRFDFRDLDGVTARYSSPQSADFVFKSLLSIDVEGGATDENIAKVFDALRALGIDGSPADDVAQEYAYLVRTAAMRRWHAADPSGWTAVVNPNASLGDRLAAARAFVEGKLGRALPADYDPDRYDYRGSGDAFGNGWRTHQRLDITGDDVRRELPGHYLVHHTGDSAGLFRALANGGGYFTSTLERYRRGVDVSKGQSVASDRASGGGAFAFLTLGKDAGFNNKYGSTHFVFDARLLARLESWSYPRDVFGNMAEDVYRDTRKSTFDEYRAITDSSAYSIKHGNETIMKHGVSMTDEMFRYVVVDGQREKAALIADLRADGVFDWPDGRSLDEIIMTRAEFQRYSGP